jgi:hypothetical protein
MTLRTAHKILISTAVVFFFGLGMWEIRNYTDALNLWALLRGLLYLSAAIGFGFYLATLKRWLK